MLFSNIRLITFDCTGTLLKFAVSPAKKYAEIGSYYGIDCDHVKLKANFKNQWEKMCEEHPNFGRHSGLGWENWWRKIVTHTFKDCNTSIDEVKLHSIATHLIEEYKGRSCWQIARGALDLLSYLKHRGLTLGVISNFDPRLHITLENNKLKHYFRFIVTSYDVGVAKPHPQIFCEAIKASNLSNLQPEECLHIGDSILLDYIGATKAGWKALVLIPEETRHSNKEDVDKSHIFYSVYDIHKYIMDNHLNEVKDHVNRR